MAEPAAAPPRPDRIYETLPEGFGVVAKPLSFWARIADNGVFRKSVLLAVLALIWQAYALWLGNSLLFPTFTETGYAFYEGMRSGALTEATFHSVWLLLKGYALGLAFAAAATAFAITTRVGADLLDTLTSMFNPLPSIALLPLAMIWFGLGEGSIIFVLVHAVLWSVALNTHAGFRSVSPTWRMVGQNYGLSSLAYVTKILIPGALPSILTGLKIGWAFAWRTLIAAELVFGVSSSGGGLGWYIFQNKNLLDIPNVFAGLLMVIIFGLIVDNFVFRVLEQRTIRRWGMQS
ncbi:ABC transporter permease [Aquabacter spiritensis]|uniref:NitT/TauT family transport system permease protein n=1 Tax=Aquabacter spiritensis TaxID=933073 RepID=A0A4V2UXW1_9HYPH|nr:ABC transporter permease [Aquabacter spiritensis]TCT05058.1 NitT/TauT family transport system permease protein [Aquabacter spiritensis]